LPAIQAAVRQLHVTPTTKAAEISSILEERILGAAPKVFFSFVGCTT
jgi:F-type H+-transporting ATPase subunit alpha